MEYNHFYIADIASLVDIQEDYLKWFLRKADIVRISLLIACVLYLQMPPCLSNDDFVFLLQKMRYPPVQVRLLYIHLVQS